MSSRAEQVISHMKLEKTWKARLRIVENALAKAFEEGREFNRQELKRVLGLTQEDFP